VTRALERLALGYAAARDRALGALSPLPARMRPLVECAGLALRGTLVAPHALPPFRNSAMDGWAVRAPDVAAASPARAVTLPVTGVVAAGQVATRALGAGEAMRIMTGAALPEGADAVVPFEHGERGRNGAGAETARITVPAEVGENVRGAGEDVAAGEVVLADGRELSPHDLALAAALGRAELAVGPAPRVAVLSTGDELLDPGAPLRPGAIRDSNLPMLALLAAGAGAELVIAERLPDDPSRVAARIEEAVAVADVVLTIGGVSVGDFDPVRQALERLGEIELWRVAMRPGRPQAFGRPRGRLFFGLPGNPASVACVFEVLVRPALRRLQGHAVLDGPRVPVRMATDVPSREGRTDFVRCTLEWRLGALWAAPAGAQVSGHLAPQARAHALVIVPEGVAELRESDEAEALWLRAPAFDGSDWA
jgi:molybdenum cofactor synthesis domain-containing protein